VLLPAPAEPELAEAFGAEDEAAFEVVADVEAVEVVEEAEPAAELTIPAAPEAGMPLAEPLIVAAVAKSAIFSSMLRVSRSGKAAARSSAAIGSTAATIRGSALRFVMPHRSA
jgi:hypothetical protein